MPKSLAHERKTYVVEESPLFVNLHETIWEDRGKIIVLRKGRHMETSLHRVGVFFSGGPAPGGHTVLAGLFDALMALHPKSELIGFLGGPSGLLEKKFIALDREKIDAFRHIGGFHLLGTGRKKIEKEEDFEQAKNVLQELRLDGFVIIGGDDSNTNAYYLQEYLKQKRLSIPIVGIPKTIDGDMKSEFVEISFGFDTACKVYSEMIGNIAFDAKSALKYWHFIKIMGRSASHVTLECALQTRINMALISEEVQEKGLSLKEIITTLSDQIIQRVKEGKNYGVLLIPEGIIESMSDMKILFKELGRIKKEEFDVRKLSKEATSTFLMLPESIQKQILLERDPHGNVQVSLIESEKLLGVLVAKAIKERAPEAKFAPQYHFLGYEGRCGFPSNFDVSYAMHLGKIAALLIINKKMGYMASVRKLVKPLADWELIGVPIEALLHEEERKGEVKRVVKKSLVDLKGAPFKEFLGYRARFLKGDLYLNPGPIQFSGPSSDLITKTLALESRSSSKFSVS